MPALATLFVVVFALNIIPAFAPPTWLALSWIEFNHPHANPFVVAPVGTCAAIAGRVVVAKLSRAVIRRRFLREQTRDNIDTIKAALERHRTLTVGAFLVYAFTRVDWGHLLATEKLRWLPRR